MPRPTSFDHVCHPRAMIACHARCRLTVCASERRLWHAMPDVVRSCVLPKGGDFMTLPTSIDRVYHPKAVMSCTPDVADRVCCPSAVMAYPARCCRLCVLSKGVHVMPRLTSSDRACIPRAVMSCHAQCCRPCVLSKCGDGITRPTLPTVCAVQERSCHATPDVVRPCMQS